MPAHHTALPSGMSHRPEDLTRSRSANRPNVNFGTPPSRGSIETMQPADHPFSDTSFSASLHDLLPMDLSSRATPDSTSTGTSSQHPYPTQPLNAPNPVHKVDSLMFPSEDPFAYPNQPMMELGFPAKDAPASLAGQGQDPQFFIPGTMEEIDSQFLGQPPPYMMQHQPGQPAMGMQNNVYDPMMGMHMGSQHHQAYQHQAQHQNQHQQRQHPAGQSLPQRRARTHRQQERQIDQMFTEQGMQPDWGSFFGSGRGGFQGM